MIIVNLPNQDSPTNLPKKKNNEKKQQNTSNLNSKPPIPQRSSLKTWK